VRTADRSWARTRLDWAIKEELLTQVSMRRGVNLADPAIERLDLAYHDIGPDGSLHASLQERGRAPRILEADRIEQARATAPTTTRARLRGQVVRTAQEHGVDHVVD
ncbi:proteasome accessory factor PafA2 family protein, partial [Enterobacter roggenkampii]